MTPPSVDATDPRDVLRLLRRRGWVLLVCAIVIPAAVYLYSERLTKTYSSTVIVQPQASADPQAILNGGGSSPSQNVAGVASVAETSSVSAGAARLEHKPIGSIRGVEASSDEDTGFVTIEVGGPTPGQAQRNARAVAEALGATRKDRSVKQIAAAIRSVQSELARETNPVQRGALQDQLQKLRTVLGAQGQNLGVVEPAGPGSLVSPHPARNALLAFIAALLIGVGLMVVVERFDRKLRKPEELEALTGVPLLGTIPHKAFPGGEPGPRISEAFQTLRDSLTYFNVDRDLTTLVVVSPLKGEGKTTVVSNLAVAFARAGKRVIAVDTDLRHPQLGSRFGIDNSPGLSEVLMGDRPESVLRSVDGLDGDLRVLPGGAPPPNPSEMLGSVRMASLLGRLPQLCDLVLIDTAPLLVISDAFALLQQSSGLVGVARLEQTPGDVVARMVEVTNTAGGRLLGMVATGAREGQRYGYGYGYGYGYAYAKENADAKTGREALVFTGVGASHNGAASDRDVGHPVGSGVGVAGAPRPGLGRRVRQLFRSD